MGLFDSGLLLSVALGPAALPQTYRIREYFYKIVTGMLTFEKHASEHADTRILHSSSAAGLWAVTRLSGEASTIGQ